MNQHILRAVLVSVLLALPTQSFATIFPSGVNSLSEFLTMRLAHFRVPAAAVQKVHSATEQAIQKSATLSASLHVVGKAEFVSNHTQTAFYLWEPVTSALGIAKLEEEYGCDREYLQMLNPGVNFNLIHGATRILLYRFNQNKPSESIGKSHRGRLSHGMPMPDGPYWHVRNHDESWGTPETISHIVRGLTYVAETQPGATHVVIGDLSYKNGGYMPPHKSHRSGRDVDMAYYSHSPQSKEGFWDARWSDDLDAHRQWRLFRFWIKQGVVSYIFVDYRIQKKLYHAALTHGEDKNFLEKVFQYPHWSGRRAIIRHIPGHDDHLHARFRCSAADEHCE